MTLFLGKQGIFLQKDTKDTKRGGIYRRARRTRREILQEDIKDTKEGDFTGGRGGGMDVGHRCAQGRSVRRLVKFARPCLHSTGRVKPLCKGGWVWDRQDFPGAGS